MIGGAARFLTSLFCGCAALALAGCVNTTPPDVKLVQSASRSITPGDWSRLVTIAKGEVFYSDTISLKRETAILKASGNRDSALGIWHKVPERTRLALTRFDGVDYFCTTERTAGSFPIEEPTHFSCYRDKENDGWFETVHPVGTDPRTGHSTRPDDVAKLPLPVPYERQTTERWGSAFTWQLVYVDRRDGYLRIDEVLRAGSSADAPERYRRSFYVRVPDEQKAPERSLWVPYQPFAGTWSRMTDNPESIRIDIREATDDRLFLSIFEPNLNVEGLRPDAVAGRHQTLPDAWHRPVQVDFLP